jgi:hypothetical protein
MTAGEYNETVNPGRITAFALLLNYLPFGQLLLGAILISSLAPSAGSALLWAAAWLFLLPPAVCRLTFAAFGTPSGRSLTQDTRAFKVWWFVHQWQILFNRLPWLEEILRLVPGLYALWIWMWGGRVSPLVYWAAGSLVTDRPLVIVEAGAVIGMGAGLAGHAGVLGADGIYRVDIASPHVGRGAVMGARSGLGPGAGLAPYRMLSAGRMIPPFVYWDGAGKRGLAGIPVELPDGQ